jgi:hypothetical protein
VLSELSNALNVLKANLAIIADRLTLRDFGGMDGDGGAGRRFPDEEFRHSHDVTFLVFDRQ